jgi:hypothetical protein
MHGGNLESSGALRFYVRRLFARRSTLSKRWERESSKNFHGIFSAISVSYSEEAAKRYHEKQTKSTVC